MTILRFDDFNRADTTNNIGTPSDGGLDWVQDAGVLGIISNQGYATDRDGTNVAMCSLESGTNLVDVSVSFPVMVNGACGVAFRASSRTATLYFQPSNIGTNGGIWKFDGATTIHLFTFNTVPSNGDIFRVTVDANDLITCYQNGAFQGAGVSSFNSTATRHGVINKNLGVRFDNFSINTLPDQGATNLPGQIWL